MPGRHVPGAYAAGTNPAPGPGCPRKADRRRNGWRSNDALTKLAGQACPARIATTARGKWSADGNVQCPRPSGRGAPRAACTTTNTVFWAAALSLLTRRRRPDPREPGCLGVRSTLPGAAGRLEAPVLASARARSVPVGELLVVSIVPRHRPAPSSAAGMGRRTALAAVPRPAPAPGLTCCVGRIEVPREDAHRPHGSQHVVSLR